MFLRTTKKKKIAYNKLAISSFFSFNANVKAVSPFWSFESTETGVPLFFFWNQIYMHLLFGSTEFFDFAESIFWNQIPLAKISLKISICPLLTKMWIGFSPNGKFLKLESWYKKNHSSLWDRLRLLERGEKMVSIVFWVDWWALLAAFVVVSNSDFEIVSILDEFSMEGVGISSTSWKSETRAKIGKN